jgi:hypothetical protein
MPGTAGILSVVSVTVWLPTSVMSKDVMFPRESVEMITDKLAEPVPPIVLLSTKFETEDVMSWLARLSSDAPVNEESNDIVTLYGEYVPVNEYPTRPARAASGDRTQSKQQRENPPYEIFIAVDFSSLVVNLVVAFGFTRDITPPDVATSSPQGLIS